MPGHVELHSVHAVQPGTTQQHLNAVNERVLDEPEPLVGFSLRAEVAENRVVQIVRHLKVLSAGVLEIVHYAAVHGLSELIGVRFNQRCRYAVGADSFRRVISQNC